MLKELKTFCEVIESNNFVQTAKKLHLSNSVVSRRIATLEKIYGVRLLNRSRGIKQISLTESGKDLYQEATFILETIDKSTNKLKQKSSGVSGILRVILPPSLFYAHIATRIPAFLKEHPKLKLHINCANYALNFLYEGYDVALNCGALPDSSFYYRKIGIWQRIPYASPKYLNKNGIPKTPYELCNHNCLMHQHHNGVWDFREKKKKFSVQLQGNICIDSSIILKQLALCDLGIAYLPTFLTSDEVSTGKLVPLLSDFLLHPEQLLAVYTSKQYISRKLELFLQFLASTLKS